MSTKPTAVDLVRAGVFDSLDVAVRFLDERDELRAEIERLRAALLVYAEEYEGNELAREVLGLPPLKRA